MMKNRLKHIIVILFIAPVLLSCKKNLANYNQNPDGVSAVKPGLLFSNALVTSSTQDMEPRTNYCHAFMQYGYSDFWSGTTYSLSDGISSRYWNNWYNPVVRNLEFVIPELKSDPSSASTYAAVRIWRAFVFQKLTDFYGDLPYSQAGQASSLVYTPAYDTQKFIYADMINELRASIVLLNNNSSQAVQGDQFYGGSAAGWKKLASSLLLRIGMRLVKIDPAQAAALVKEAVNDGVMAGNTDMPVLKHNADAPDDFYYNLGDQHFFLHKTLVTRMKVTGDPRLSIYGAVYDKGANQGGVILSTDTTKYIGYSFNATDPLPNTRVTYSVYQPQATPFFEFPYAEVAFLQAEAVLRGFISGDANTFYQAGITASMQSLALLPGNPTISSAQIVAYLAKNPLAGTSDQQIDLINTEFWVSGFVFDADEVWANWRRTGYPALVPNPNTITGPSSSPGVIPRKLPYPQSEFTYNSINVNNALKAYGGLNNFNAAARVWWDK
jgi:hypothetical protein